MALQPIPPWLAIQPNDYLDAVKAGTAAGLEIAQANNRATAAANERAARMWEFERGLEQRALEQAAERERAAAVLEASTRYNLGRLAGQEASLEETRRYHDLMARNAAEANRIRELKGSQVSENEKIFKTPDGGIVLLKRDPTTGQWGVSDLRKGQKLVSGVSGGDALQLLMSGKGPIADAIVGPGTQDYLKRQARLSTIEAMPPQGPLTNPVPTTATVTVPTAPPTTLPVPAAGPPAAPMKRPRIYMGPSEGGEPAPGKLGEGEEKKWIPREGRWAVFDSGTKKFLRWGD